MTKKEAIDLVSRDGSELKNLSANFRDDKEIVLAAVSNYGSSLEYASSAIKADKEIVLKAVKNGGYPLEFADENLKADREVVLEAVKSYGWVLQYASIPLKNDKEIVMESLREYGEFIRYSSDQLKKDKEVILKAISNWNDEWFVRDFFDTVPQEMHNDPDIMIAVLQKLNIVDNIEVISKSFALLNDNEFIQKLIELKLVSSKGNLKYKKKIGKYTIVADLPPKSNGALTPDGSPLKKNENGIEYEQDYFYISTLSNLHVEDEDGNICTPIIKEIEVENSGYVCTWSSTFWVQGFAILDNEIYFISIGEDIGYYSKKPVINRIKAVNNNTILDYEFFITDMIEPINLQDEVNFNLNDYIYSGQSNENNKELSDFMLL